MKTTTLRDVHVLPDGRLEANFELTDDLGKRLHTIVFNPCDDSAERLTALNRSLVDDLGFPAVDVATWATVSAAQAQVATPEVKAAWEAAEDAEKAAADALATVGNNNGNERAAQFRAADELEVKGDTLGAIQARLKLMPGYPPKP